MWPLLLDMTCEESKRVLRRLELEAYSAVISVFRAQGELSKDKKKQLQDLQATLSISTERHRAEVRRAVNDEKLTTIADNTFGPDTSAEWLIEGRRLVPLMPRLVPQTAFTLTANQAANLQAEKNAAMPTPSQTGNKDWSSPPIVTTPTMTPTAVAKMPRPGSPSSNVVVLPSGVSVHIKDEVDEIQTRKRKRSHSAEGVSIGSDYTGAGHPQVNYNTSTSHCPSPMKITISKSPQTKSQTSLTSTPPQKVILLSSSGQSTAANILQKSVSVPMVRASAGSNTTYSSGFPKTSIVYPGSSSSPASNGNLGNIVTVATTSALQHVSTSGASSQVYTQQQGGSVGFTTPTGTKPRMKTVTRQRLAHSGVTSLTGPRPGLVVPMVPQSVHGLSHSGHIKTLGKPTIQIKQEGGMKIITQTLPTSSKLLPKPSTVSSSGTPIVVVSSGSQTNTSGSVTMVTRPLTSSGGGSLGSKILNITTQGRKVIATTNKAPNVVTVNPKTLHLTAVKTAAGVAGGKPNVIVVQKSQGKKLIGQGATMVTTKTAVPFDKELVSFIQKHDPQKIVTAKTVDNKVILTTSAHDFSALRKSRSESDGKTSLLAELIQAASAGMAADTPTTSVHQSPIIIEESSTREATPPSNLPIKAVTPVLPQNLANEWFEYDVAEDIPSTSLPNQSKPAEERQHSVDLTQDASSSDSLSLEQLYTLEQAMNMVNTTPHSKGVTETACVSLVDNTASMEGTNTNQSQHIRQIRETKATVEAVVKDPLNKLDSLTSMVPSLTPDLLQGDLDPQTGIFHSTNSDAPEQAAEGNKRTVNQSMDLLSTSLAQAQIDLDPYQFMEEDIGTLTSLHGSEVKVTPQATILGPTKPEGQRSQKEALVSILTGNVVQDARPVLKELEGSGLQMPAAEPSQGSSSVRAASSFIPIEELGNKASRAPINVTTKASALSGGDNSSVTVTMLPKGLDPGALTLEDLTSQRLQASEEVISPPSPEIELETSESSELMASQSTSEFSSQGLYCDPGSLSEPGNISDGGLSDSSVTRVSKRRRKPPASFDDSQTPSSSGMAGSWIRAAVGILSKVSKVRGSNKDRSDFDASSWFLYPVDPEDAPDYFNIIKNPMDFSTIKKKLETSEYRDFEEFHADMMLVCENCNTYNPPGHQARLDCLEVFGIYHQEHNRLMEKWQKSHTSSPVAKKMKLDKSPGKS